MRLCIEDKETAYIDIAVCCERRACIESKIWLLLHEREVFITFIFPHIVGNNKVILALFSFGLRKGNSILLLA
jgi:hypothetical protein